jgi:hypothetical protein
VCTTGDASCPTMTTCVQAGSFYTCQCTSGYIQNGWDATVPYYPICVPSQNGANSNQTLVIALCASAGGLVLIVVVVVVIVLRLRRQKQENSRQRLMNNAASRHGGDKINQFGEQNRAAAFAYDWNDWNRPTAAPVQREYSQASSAEQLPGSQAY